nr:ATP-grasp fold amidoligase family protein [Pontibacter vulgaris]
MNKVLKRKGNDFAERIRNRNNEFWGIPEGKSIKAIPMNAHDPLPKWQDVKYWQRKLSNKYNARLFAQMHGCKVADLYWRGKDLNQVNFDDLPDQYVIRPTIGYGCDMVYLMDNHVNHMDNCTYTSGQIRDNLMDALQQNPNQEFLIEEFLRTEQGEYKIPVDYKIHTFNGEIAFIHLIKRLSPSKGYSTFYDVNWNQLGHLQDCYPAGTYQQAPECLNEMLEQARTLSKAYEIFVRIDFYATDKGAVFGEFTPTPAMGKNYKPEGVKILLNFWDTYCKEMV